MKTFFLTCTVLIFSLSVFAWGNSGHMISGAFAYSYLKTNNPAVLAKALVTLQNHPWFTTRWNDSLTGLTGDARDEGIFMLAARYPDDLKTVSGVVGGSIMKEWHYTDYPFVPIGDTVTGQPAKTPNVELKLDTLFSTFASEPEGVQKAIDLCWIFHLIGDIHQPLHTASLFCKEHPTGDSGGNDTYYTKSQELHAYWDGIPKGDFASIPDTATMLLAEPKYKESKLTELSDTDYHDWIKKESFDLAVSTAYDNGTIRGTKAVPTPLNAAYKKKAKTVAERRLVLSGIRIAKKLIEFYS